MYEQLYVLEKMESRPYLQLTKTTILADRLIDELTPLLQDLSLKLIGRDMRKLTPQSIKKIVFTVQNYITTSYLLGQKYNNKFNDVEIPLTKNDIIIIHDLTNDVLKRLFISIQKPKIKEYIWVSDGISPDYLDFNEFDFDDIDDIELDDLLLEFPELEDEFDFSFMNDEYNDAISAGDYTLANDISDVRNNPLGADITSRKSSGGVIFTISKGDFNKDFFISDSRLANMSSDSVMKSLNQGTLSNTATGRVEYVTRRDSKVCPICEDLDGDVYTVDQLSGIIEDAPIIPDDTHPNCRCRYLSVDDGGEVLVG